MAVIKKNQMTNIMFPIVDGTDFATIESGITASNFDSKMTKKFYGVTHGNSTAATSGTISKAAVLVHSGIMQQTLKATETNYDYLVYSFIPNNASLAQQILVFQAVDYDDSDLMSRLSDVGSDLLSYLTGMSGAISDIDSQLLLNASMISDAYSLISDVDSQLLLNASMISDTQSAVALLATSDYLSQVHSDLYSAIGGVTATLSASDISDIASAVWAADYSVLGAQASSFGSKFLINTSRLSDVQSAVALLATSDYLSQVHSDLYSAIGGVTATLSASDISDIASAVWAADYSVLGAGASSFGSKFLINTSRISDIYSLVSDVDSQVLLNASMISDVQSAVALLATSDYLSQVHSDLYSAIGGVTATLSASDISDIASAVWAADYSVLGAGASSFGSKFLINTSRLSDVQSALDSQFAYLSNAISDMHSDLTSQIGDIGTGTVTASDISDIVSGVWAGSYSILGAGASTFGSLLWTTMSKSQFSDIMSNIDAVTASVSASDISDIASAVWSEKYNTYSAVSSSFGSFLTQQIQGASNLLSNISGLVSDVDSQLLLNASAISDIESQVDLLATSNYLSQVHSDIYSAIGGITAGVTESDMSDIASRVWATAEGTRVDSRILVIQSMVSDVDSQLLLNASNISDIESAIDALNDPTAAAIADAVWDEPYSDHLSASTIGSRVQNIMSMASDIDSQLLLNASMISDTYSLAQDIDSQLLLNASAISDIESQLDLTASGVSDIESQLDVTHSLLSDVESAVDALWTGALTEDYATDGAAATPAQLLYMIWSNTAEFSISGTTLTVKKLDGSTTAMTFTLDDASDPTSRTRAS